MESNIVKKAKEMRIVSQSVNATTVEEFYQRINTLLAEGWDLFASQSIGLDTGGGVSGGGNVMMVITLAKYEFLTLTPSANA